MLGKINFSLGETFYEFIRLIGVRTYKLLKGVTENMGNSLKYRERGRCNWIKAHCVTNAI